MVSQLMDLHVQRRLTPRHLYPALVDSDACATQRRTSEWKADHRLGMRSENEDFQALHWDMTLVHVKGL